MRKFEQQFVSKTEFHKKNAKLSFEEKVAQVIELQKIDIEFSNHKNEKRSAYKFVWDLNNS